MICSLICGFLPDSARAVDSLGVGWRESFGSWNLALESSRLVAFSPDSIWMWNVAANANLGPGVVERGGFMLFRGEQSATSTFVDGAQVMYDGDETTAFNPDDFARRTEMERTTALYIDLGSTFRVNRIRLFPRLDPEHRHLFPRAFSLATSDGLDEDTNLLERPFTQVFTFFPSNPNREPVVERRFPSRDVRYIRLQVLENRAWEIAELEVYGDGTLPVGEFVSKPIFAAKGPRPLWGRVRYEGGDITRLPVTVQTRSGPDKEPLFYYRLTGVGSDRERVASSTYVRLDSVEKGPVLPNPAWSQWQTVTDGLVRSPGTVPYIQFRVLMTQPGTVLRRLIIEYINPPIAELLTAEIAPLDVDAGVETTFTLSLQTRMRVNYSDGSRLPNGDTGFQTLRIRTAAEVRAVEKVLIDDRQVGFNAAREAGQGTTIRLGRTILQDGTFLQIVFRGVVFRDATLFDVQAIDRRLLDGRVVSVDQSAREGDVDPLSLGGSLVVRVRSTEGELPLLAQVEPSGRAFTPNGDGVNDVFSLRYALLKLTRSAEVFFDIYDLQGRRLRRIESGGQVSGPQVHTWDGRDEMGQLVAPGLYLYSVRVDADVRRSERQGVVGVVY